MHFSLPTLVVAGLAIGQATATGWRLDARKFSVPANTKNECSTDQKSGYNWEGLEPGSFNSYGSNKFSGFKCGNSFGKRDGVTKRSFQDKCISADIDKEPKIECDKKDKMTIDSYQVSSSWDTDIEAHHEMPDGSSCKQTHRCTKGGNTVRNTQCAGSKGVTFRPKRGDSGKNKKGESCSIGIHSIDFKCEDNTPSSTQPAYTAPTTSSIPAYTSDVASSYESSVESSTESSTEISPETSSVPTFSSYANVSSTYPVESSAATPSSYEATTSSTEVIPESTAPAYESSTTETSPETSAPPYKTSTAVESTASSYGSDSSSTEVSPETSAPAYESSSGVVPSNSTAPATTTGEESTPTGSYETPDTPDLLPQCVNTWVGQYDCKDNSDSDCYCRNPELVKKIMECLESWSDDDDEIQGAAAYFQGICAPYVPENPAIITACPSGNKPPVSETAPVPEGPQETAPVSEASSTEGSPITSTSAELTTSTIYSTAVSTITACPPEVKDCPADSQTTAVVTETVAISTTVCPVSEAETPKSSTEGSPETTGDVPAETSPAPTAPAEPSTLTYYSTSAVTITSCAEDVEDCPASSTVVSSTEIPVSYSVVETPAASSPASPEQITSAPPAPESEAPAPYTSAATSPKPTAPAGPSTVITYSSSIEVPATYSTGESYGEEIPGSSTYATVDTTITVPQVQFVTSTITVPGSTSTISVGLAAGSPSDVPAYPTPTADSVGGGSVKPTGSSGFGTSYVPSSTAGPITPYEGSASNIARTGFAGVAIGAAVAFFVI